MRIPNNFFFLSAKDYYHLVEPKLCRGLALFLKKSLKFGGSNTCVNKTKTWGVYALNESITTD